MRLILLTVFVLVFSGCQATQTDYIETDKVQILFGDGEYARLHNGVIDDKQKVISQPENMRLAIRMNIGGVKKIVISDISSGKYTCGNRIPTSPAMIVSVNLAPEADVRLFETRVQAPCATYHKDFNIEIKIETNKEKYIFSKKLPVTIGLSHGNE